MEDGYEIAAGDCCVSVGWMRWIASAEWSIW
jgi:hypothetical protein